MDAKPDILTRIEAYKREEIAAARLVEDAAHWRARAQEAPAPRPFLAALRARADAGQPALIAEIKRASPSKGLIRSDFEPAALARQYAEGGAACLSVLTDGPSFQGEAGHLREARAATSLPVLRKDFMFVPEQVFQARAWGADCILVIMTAVDDETALALVDAAAALGMAALLEVHDENDLERACALPSPLIGINNRDLRTFHTDLSVTERLAPLAPKEAFIVAESGIADNADVVRLSACGVGAFLVGESLMRQADVAKATRALLGAPLTHLDAAGAAHMVDVGSKAPTRRLARAEGFVTMEPDTLAAVRAGDLKKGDVLSVARIAGIMAAKRTAELIPLCHPIPLSSVSVELALLEDLPGVRVEASVATEGRTGVEMEALTAASVACLTVYDMAKALDKGMTIGPVRLLTKSGGRSGDWQREPGRSDPLAQKRPSEAGGLEADLRGHQRDDERVDGVCGDRQNELAAADDRSADRQSESARRDGSLRAPLSEPNGQCQAAAPGQRLLGVGAAPSEAGRSEPGGPVHGSADRQGAVERSQGRSADRPAGLACSSHDSGDLQPNGSDSRWGDVTSAARGVPHDLEEHLPGRSDIRLRDQPSGTQRGNSDPGEPQPAGLSARLQDRPDERIRRTSRGDARRDGAWRTGRASHSGGRTRGRADGSTERTGGHRRAFR